MKESGLGTAATRAETIEKLVRSEYLERKKKHLLPTPKGVALVDQVDAQLRDPVLTAQWEERLADIEDGKANSRDLEADVASWVAKLVPSILRSKPMSEETAQESLGPCPKCKTGFVRKTPKGWGCSRYKEAGCAFVIWAEVAGKTIGEAVARELVLTGMSARVIDGFVSKEKKTFGAKLKLDPDHKVVFAFEERPPAQDLGPCPACKEGRVRATPKGWGCSRYKEGCTLSIWREYHGKTLSEHVARELVEHGATSKPVEGLVVRDSKKKYSAKLRFDERWRVVPVFEDKPAQAAEQPSV
jgi:DNA topoisomerase-3